MNFFLRMTYHRMVVRSMVEQPTDDDEVLPMELMTMAHIELMVHNLEWLHKFDHSMDF